MATPQAKTTQKTNTTVPAAELVGPHATAAAPKPELGNSVATELVQKSDANTALGLEAGNPLATELAAKSDPATVQQPELGGSIATELAQKSDADTALGLEVGNQLVTALVQQSVIDHEHQPKSIEHIAKSNILYNGKIIEAGTALPEEMSVVQLKELLALGAI